MLAVLTWQDFTYTRTLGGSSAAWPEDGQQVVDWVPPNSTLSADYSPGSRYEITYVAFVSSGF